MPLKINIVDPANDLIAIEMMEMIRFMVVMAMMCWLVALEKIC
jgi:hypothetical protein